MNKPTNILALLIALAAPGTFAAHSQGLSGATTATVPADPEATRKAAQWTATLQLKDAQKEAAVQQVIATHLAAIWAYHAAHPYTETPAGLHPGTGQPLSVMDRTLITVSAMPRSIHDSLMAGLRQHLTPAQVEAVLDQYTIGKVAFTLNGYKSIVPDLTPTEEAVILNNLKLAREQAVDFKNMKEISAVFEIYKNKNEAYLNTHGRNWRELFKAYVDGVNARKAADKAKAAAPATVAPK